MKVSQIVLETDKRPHLTVLHAAGSESRRKTVHAHRNCNLLSHILILLECHTHGPWAGSTCPSVHKSQIVSCSVSCCDQVLLIQHSCRLGSGVAPVTSAAQDEAAQNLPSCQSFVLRSSMRPSEPGPVSLETQRLSCTAVRHEISSCGSCEGGRASVAVACPPPRMHPSGVQNQTRCRSA